jgi:hypothetical protein
MALHDVIDGIERELKEKFRIETSIHMDPIVTDDEMTNQTRTRLTRMVGEIDPSLSIHDFRMTAGPLHTNLIFDITVPYGCPLPDEQVERAVKIRWKTWRAGPITPCSSWTVPTPRPSDSQKIHPNRVRSVIRCRRARRAPQQIGTRILTKKGGAPHVAKGAYCRRRCQHRRAAAAIPQKGGL